MLQAKFVAIHDKDGARKVEQLAHEIWPEHYRPIIGDNQVRYMLVKFQSVDAIIWQMMEGMRYFLIMAEKEYIGYFAFQVSHKKNELFLSKLYLKPNMRGQGVGRQAMEYIETVARQEHVGRVSLAVNKRNAPAVWFYESQGFRKSSAVIKDIGGGYVMDDFIYSRPVIDLFAKAVRDRDFKKNTFAVNSLTIGVILISAVAIAMFKVVYFPEPIVVSTAEDRIDFKSSPKQQTMLGAPLDMPMFGGIYVMTPVAQYKIQGVVLAKYFYLPYQGWDRLSPYDLVIAWDELARAENARLIQIKHDSRSHSIKVSSKASFEQAILNKYVSNNHIIAKNRNVQAAISKIRPSDLVRLEGALVNVRRRISTGPEVWKTSMSRDDDGVGSCEVMYVTRVTVGGKVYE